MKSDCQTFVFLPNKRLLEFFSEVHSLQVFVGQEGPLDTLIEPCVVNNIHQKVVIIGVFIIENVCMFDIGVIPLHVLDICIGMVLGLNGRLGIQGIS